MTNPDWYNQAFYRVSVVGVIRNNAGEYLMVHEHGRWTLPGGGWDYDEDLHKSLRRELFEEIALTSSFTESVVKVLPFFNSKKKAWSMWVVCDIAYDELEYGVGDDADEVRWMSKNEIDYTTMAGTLIKQIVEREEKK